MTRADDLWNELKGYAQFGTFEELLQTILSEYITTVPILTKIPPKESEQRQYPMIVVRRFRPPGGWGGDPRGLLDEGGVSISVFTLGLNATETGQRLSEGIRGVMRQAESERKYYPGLGSIVSARMIAEPANESDWATSAGPVQYADLPTAVVRYTTDYRLVVRPDMK